MKFNDIQSFDVIDSKTITLVSDYCKDFPCDYQFFMSNFRGVEIINFGNNSIRLVPQWFEIIDTIRVIDFGYNPIRDISALDGSYNVATLVFGSGSIIDFDSIPNLIKRLKKLNINPRNSEYKNVYHLEDAVELESLSAGIGVVSNFDVSKLFNLKSLHLTVLSGVKTAPAISALPNLKKLNLMMDEYDIDISKEAKNKLIKEIENSREIEKLYIYGDIAKKINYQHMTNLKTLHSRESSMKSFPDSLLNKNSLENLSIVGSLITRIPEEINTIVNLKTLDISYNRKLKLFPQGVLKLNNLLELDITYTGIKDLPIEVALMPSILKLRYTSDSISENSLFYNSDLLGVYKHLTKQQSGVQYTILELPEIIRGAMLEYLVYFDEYYKNISGKEIVFNVIKHEKGLRVEVDKVEGDDVLHFQKAFFGYTQYLLKRDFSILEKDISVDKSLNKIKILEFELNNQAENFKRKLEFLEFKNEMLYSQIDSYKNVIDNMSKQTISIYVSQDNNNKQLSKLNSVNNINIDSAIEPLDDIYKILKEFYKYDSLKPNIEQVKSAVNEQDKEGIIASIGGFFQKTSTIIEKAHVALVDAPEVVEKLKFALDFAHKALHKNQLGKLAEMADKLFHSLPSL